MISTAIPIIDEYLKTFCSSPPLGALFFLSDLIFLSFVAFTFEAFLSDAASGTTEALFVSVLPACVSFVISA